MAKSTSNHVIDNDHFDILHNMLLLKNINGSKNTVKNKSNETKTRKKR